MKRKINKQKDLEQLRPISFSGIGLTPKEKRWGHKHFADYKDRYHIDSLSDIGLLEELVFREVMQERFKSLIGKMGEDKKKPEDKTTETIIEVVPKYILNSLNDNLEQILILKDKLGLIGENKADDPFKYIQTLKKKFKKWREENQGSRTFPCPHCSKMVLLKIRTIAWEALQHPFFKDRILANKHLWKLCREGTITPDDIAKILGCSSDYVTWLEDKIYGNKSK